MVLMAGMMTLATAQKKVDAERMDRDLRVAENVLATLLSEEFDNHSYRYATRSVTAQHIEDYGVVFTLPGNMGFPRVSRFTFASGKGDMTEVIEHEMGETEEIRGSRGRHHDQEERAERLAKEAEKLAQRAEEVAVRVLSGTSKKDWEAQHSGSGFDKEKLVKVIKTFMLDYGDLLSQLGEKDKIMVADGRMGWGSESMSYQRATSRTGADFTVWTEKKVISDFKAGKLSRTEAEAKILIDEPETRETSSDVEVFGTVMSRLYKSDLSKTFYVTRNISHEYIKDYGLIFWMKVYSSTIIDGRYSIITANKSDLSKEERDQIVDDLYPLFTEDLKNNILEYGRMLKSIEPEEKVIFKVNLTECDPCKMPGAIELIVTKKVLDDYASGKIKKEEALKNISLKVLN